MKPWPADLTDDELEHLVDLLDQAVAAAADLPATLEINQLITASAQARHALRQRIATQKIDDARMALAEYGWAP